MQVAVRGYIARLIKNDTIHAASDNADCKCDINQGRYPE